MKYTSSLGAWCQLKHLLAGTGLVLNLAATHSLHAQYSLSNLWKISTGDNRPYVTTNATERGIAYNPANNHVYLVSRAGGSLRVAILDGDTGSEIGFLGTAGVSGGVYNLSTIAVAEDGAIYGANLVTSGNGFKVYRWTDEAALPIAVFTGNPAGTLTGRWGDNLDLRGGGTNTEILVASGDLTLAAILKPTDDTMTQFASVGITVSSLAAGDMQKGVGFDTNKTCYARRTG